MQITLHAARIAPPLNAHDSTPIDAMKIPRRAARVAPFLNQAERGTTLFEVALAIAILGSLLVFVNAMVFEETTRQRDRSLGRDLQLMTKFAQQYLKVEYSDLQTQLAGLSTTDAIMEISMQTLVDAGYLPSSFLQNGEHLNGARQSFAILIRAVSRLDSGNPQRTLTVAEIDVDDDDQVDADLVDGESTNDELDIESLLVTSSGNPLLPQHGNPAVVASDLPTVGYVQTAGVANGPFGNWSLDISPYAALDSYPDAGRFVSLLALSGFGVLDFWNSEPNDGSQVFPGNLFERCPGFSGRALAECMANNDVYTDLRFRPVDTDDDGTDDLFPKISGLLRLACVHSSSGLAVAGTLLLDCDDVRLSGNATIDGDLEVSGDASAERFIAAAIGDQDLTKGIYQGQIIAMDGRREIDKPDCQDSDSEAMILVAPAAFSSPDGSPIVGLKAFADDNTDKWTITLQAALDRDSNVDGQADVIELVSADDHALALTKCG